jgi:hypothetical protein
MAAPVEILGKHVASTDNIIHNAESQPKVQQRLSESWPFAPLNAYSITALQLLWALAAFSVS